MRKSVLTLAAVAACANVGGCMTAALGAAASVGVLAVQDRTIGEGIDDASASQQVKARLMAADRLAFQEVDVEVAGRNLLLSGVAPTAEHRAAAETIARGVPTLQHIFNEIAVGPPSSFARNAQDEWITAQVRTRMTASSFVRAINFNIETFNGNVYLMGTARSEQELQRAAEIASLVRGVQRVVSFVEVRAALASAVDDASVEIVPVRVRESAGPARVDPEFLATVTKISEAMWPGVPVIPTMGTGATDSTYFRRVGIPAYGVSGLFDDLDDYRALVLETSSPKDPSPIRSAPTERPQTSLAPSRDAMMSLQKAADAAAARVDELSTILPKIDAALAAPNLYARDRVRAIKLQKERSALLAAIARAEENWLMAIDAVEAAKTAQNQ